MYSNIDEAWGCNISLPKVRTTNISDEVCKIYNKPFQIADTDPYEEKYNKVEYEHHSRAKQSKQAIIEKGNRLFEAYDDASSSSEKCSVKHDDDEIDKYFESKKHQGDDVSDKKQYMNFLLFVITGVFFIIIFDLFFRMGQFSMKGK